VLCISNELRDSSHPDEPTIKSINTQLSPYTTAINESVQMARGGINLAGYAINCIENAFKHNFQLSFSQEVEQSIALMKSLALEGLKNANQVQRDFQNIRGSLLQVCFSPI
jgi:hypothetical protein